MGLLMHVVGVVCLLALANALSTQKPSYMEAMQRAKFTTQQKFGSDAAAATAAAKLQQQQLLQPLQAVPRQAPPSNGKSRRENH